MRNSNIQKDLTTLNEDMYGVRVMPKMSLSAQ